MRKNKVCQAETVIDSDGRNIPIRYLGAPVHDKDGTVIGALESFVDVTELQQALDVSSRENWVREGEILVNDKLQEQSELADLCDNILIVLNQWLDDLRQDMGLSAMTYGRNLIYATKAGKGTAPHFDQNMNFVIQIHGTKKWWLAANKNVENPMTRHLMGLPMDDELTGYATAPMPTKMPDDATEITLNEDF